MLTERDITVAEINKILSNFEVTVKELPQLNLRTFPANKDARKRLFEIIEEMNEKNMGVLLDVIVQSLKEGLTISYILSILDNKRTLEISNDDLLELFKITSSFLNEFIQSGQKNPISGKIHRGDNLLMMLPLVPLYKKIIKALITEEGLVAKAYEETAELEARKKAETNRRKSAGEKNK